MKVFGSSSGVKPSSKYFTLYSFSLKYGTWKFKTSIFGFIWTDVKINIGFKILSVDSMLTHFFPMFPFDPPKNIRKHISYMKKICSLKTTASSSTTLTLCSGWAFSGLLRDGEGLFGPPPLKSVTHILQWWNLA